MTMTRTIKLLTRYWSRHGQRYAVAATAKAIAWSETDEPAVSWAEVGIASVALLLAAFSVSMLLLP
jgi:hypothetical protein